MDSSSSRLAFSRASSEPNRAARSRAVLRPTLGMPMAKMNRSSGRLRLAERHGHRVIRLFHHGGVIFAVRLRQHVVGGALLRSRGGPGRGIPPRLCPVRRRGGSLAPLGGVQRNVNIHAATLRAVRKRRGSRILSARVPFRPVGRRAAALLFAMSEQGGKQPFLLFSSAGQPSHLTFPKNLRAREKKGCRGSRPRQPVFRLASFRPSAVRRAFSFSYYRTSRRCLSNPREGKKSTPPVRGVPKIKLIYLLAAKQSLQ